MIGPYHGKYALIQFCPQPDRQEFLNVGLILSVPDAEEYLRVEFVEEPKRVERLFGNISDHYYHSVSEVIKFRIEQGFRQSKPFDFDEFVDDDGITNRIEGGLSLQVKTEAVANTGSWKVYAKIV